jgi:ribosomal protein S18 acetylase RimI-like enzyme
MTYEYRKGRPRDARACAQIIHNWDAEVPWMVPLDTLDSMTEFWRSLLGTAAAWVAENNGEVVGFCARNDDNIAGLYVDRHARNCGVGKRLLDLAKADRDWITVWAYEANTAARKFYRREGLIEISREMEVYDDGSRLMDVEHRWTRQS